MEHLLILFSFFLIFGTSSIIAIYTPQRIIRQFGIYFIQCVELQYLIMRMVVLEVIPHAFYRFYMERTQFLRTFVHSNLT